MGFKPSGGLISNKGILGVSKEYDTPGPIASCVTDVVTLFGLFTKNTDIHTTGIGSLNTPALRIGIPRSGFPISCVDGSQGLYVYPPELTGEAERHFATVVDRLKESCSVQDPADVPDVVRFSIGDDPRRNGPWVSVLYTHLSATVSDFLRMYSKGGKIKSLKDLADWNSKQPVSCRPTQMIADRRV